ncbi:uncharacterized protein LOC132715910 [Ruditapes philippinarum]|uniref:uncharacterized protein LOC132715910 n=1 Tax=Ruditapes philippinarum TaxID=129788 RepID=UPI00295BF591|nr:uncharacterized protein LOC132715910 [Ruditapes philippinarum]
MKGSSKISFLLSFVILTAVGTLSTDGHFSGPNIALNKPAVQRPGTFENNAASLAVDGNADREVEHGSCSHTTGVSYDDNSYGSAQWKVYLGSSFNVTGIIIVNRNDLKYRLEGFQVFGSVSNGMGCIDGWCQLYDDKEHNKFNEDLIEIKVDTINLFSVVAINLPKRQSSQDNDKVYLTLCEVKIYAAPPTVCESSEVSHGGLKPNKPFFEVNTVATVYCENGYKAKHQHIYCLKTNNGPSWNDSPECIEVKCVIPANPANGLYSLGTNTNVQNLTVFVGTSISGTCLKGFTVQIEGYPYKTIVTAACNDSFKLSNPNKIRRTCMIDGKWDSEPVTCMRTRDTSTDTASQNTNVPLIIGVSAAIVLVVSAIVAIGFILYRRNNTSFALNSYTSLIPIQTLLSDNDMLLLEVL